MSETRRLASQLERTLNGDAWYGPSWREVLDGVGVAAAMHRAVQQGHTIAEIVLHIITWHEVVTRRFGGEVPQVTDEQDWPRARLASEQEWTAAVQRLFDTGRVLAETMARFPESRVEEERPNNAGTWYTLMIGIVEHDVYHSGQVGLLRKAALAAGTRA
jgi:hypothetical protein